MQNDIAPSLLPLLMASDLFVDSALRMLRSPPRCILPRQLLCGPVYPRNKVHSPSGTNANDLNKRPTSGLKRFRVSSVSWHGLVAPWLALNEGSRRCLHSEHVVLPPSDAQKSTIYALSTPAGKAGVGVIRISGPHALKEVWGKMVKPYSRSSSKGI